MTLDALAQMSLKLVPRQQSVSPQISRPLSGLTLLLHHQVTQFEATVYEPVVCLILQGRKETVVGERTLSAKAGQVLLVSHDLPVVWRVTRAPYLALLLPLDLALLRGLYEELSDAAFDAPASRAFEVHQADAALIDAMGRLVSLAHTPDHARVLAPLILKELHYRLLMAPFGGSLRQLIRHDSQESAIARAIARIRREFRTPLAVPALAKSVGMSSSAFHKHFKSVTESTPLQYQKDLRLLEARRLLTQDRVSVSSAAFDVGYESPNQFSREYARKFGNAPSGDR